MEVKEGHEAKEAQASLPRRLQIVAQKRIQRIQKKKKWEQPKGNSRQEVLPDIKIRPRAIRRARSATYLPP